jgi:chromosome segregation ATPase
MRRAKDSESVAVAEAPPRTPAEIAATAARASEGMRRAALRDDVNAWREIVHDIASGIEPSGETLATIAVLATRLRLPEGALADHVAAIGRERDLLAQAEQLRHDVQKAKDRDAALRDEIRNVERRLRELTAEAGLAEITMVSAAQATSVVTGFRLEHPVLFADLDTMVARVVAKEASQQTSTLQGKP